MTRTFGVLGGLAATGALVVGLVRCVGDEPSFPDVDGGGGPDAGAIDSAAPPPCDPSKPFGDVTNVAELNGTTDDESARLTPDELSVYFSRRAGPGPNDALLVFVATRGTTADAFGALTQLTLRLDPSGPSIEGDRSALYYSSDGTDGGIPDLFEATPPFNASTSTSLTAVNSSGWDFTPYIRPDGSELYFTSDRAGSEDIWVSARENGAFVAPVVVPSVASPKSERTPVITGNGHVLYFASDRAGSYDIYVARRDKLSLPFGDPKVVMELATTSIEMPDWISPDECTLYFRSDRPGGKGGKDIWRATRGK